MSFIGKEVQDFKVWAFHEQEFKEISKQDMLGKWVLIFFYPADLIVNPQGVIKAYEVLAGNVGRNVKELLCRLPACQLSEKHGDEVCPANWKSGEETLKPSLDLVGLL